MFVKYMNEDVSFDSLKSLENTINELQTDIANCEKEVNQVKRGANYQFGRYNTSLLSELEQKELAELDSRINELDREYNKLYNSFMKEVFIGYDEDGHKEYDYEVENADLEAELRPKMKELHAEANSLRQKVAEIEKRVEILSKDAADQKYSELEIDSKNARLKTARDEHSKMVASLIASNNLDWAAEALRDNIAENISAEVTISDKYISKENGKIWLHVTFDCNMDLSNFDLNDLNWDDFSGCVFPDSYADYDIKDLIRWYGTSNLDLENPDDGKEYTFESHYVSHTVTNNVDCEDDGDGDIYLEGEYILEISFKLAYNN